MYSWLRFSRGKGSSEKSLRIGEDREKSFRDKFLFEVLWPSYSLSVLDSTFWSFDVKEIPSKVTRYLSYRIAGFLRQIPKSLNFDFAIKFI